MYECMFQSQPHFPDDGLTILHGIERRYDYLDTLKLFPDLCKTQAILDQSEMRFLEPENNFCFKIASVWEKTTVLSQPGRSKSA